MWRGRSDTSALGHLLQFFRLLPVGLVGGTFSNDCLAGGACFGAALAPLSHTPTDFHFQANPRSGTSPLGRHPVYKARAVVPGMWG